MFSNCIKHWNVVAYGVCEAGIHQTICKLYIGKTVKDPEHYPLVLLILYADMRCLIASGELQ